MCGGTAPTAQASRPSRGLSPRVRGNQDIGGRDVLAAGSIPACAGEPGNTITDIAGWKVYPRVCGGTAGDVVPAAVGGGLSPRVRGNLPPI